MTSEGGSGRGPGQRSLDRRAADELAWARWAVGRWSRFPVEQTPRPLVLVGPRVHGPGFATGPAKEAFMQGRWDPVIEVPTAVLDALSADARPTVSNIDSGLRITAIELAESEFMTDRGRRELPAWRLTAEDALGPIWVLDPAIDDWQPTEGDGGARPDLQTPGHDPFARVQVGSDDRSLVVDWLGAAPEFERYLTAEIIETPQAFAVVAIGEDVGPDGYRTLAGHLHQLPAVLKDPIGARVYVDLHGHAGQVISSAGLCR